MAPNTPIQPKRPTTPDASTAPAGEPTAAQAGPPKAAQNMPGTPNPSQGNANPERARNSDVVGCDMD